MRAFGVTIWNSVPALLEILLAAAEADGWPSSLRLVLVSGDWVAPQTAERVKEHAPECRFIALGGATEASIWSNAFEVDRVDFNWRSVPYGFPLANQRFRVVDYQGRDCPDHVPGELWIGGKGLAQGYRGDRVNSALRFVHQQGERWYRTGDRGRYLPGAMLEFLGRSDLQVKIRGYRVELGEVEAALQSHPGVSRAVAVMLANETTRLAAAVVPAFPLQVSEVRAAVAAKLPRYMIPDRIILIEQLPLTTNGKVDRTALAAALGRPDDRLIEERPQEDSDDLAHLLAEAPKPGEHRSPRELLCSWRHQRCRNPNGRGDQQAVRNRHHAETIADHADVGGGRLADQRKRRDLRRRSDMNALDLIAHLENEGVRLWEDGRDLRFRASSGVMTPERQGELRREKEHVIALLRRRHGALLLVDDPRRGTNLFR